MEKVVVSFINYSATHPDAIIKYRPRKNILWVHSNTSYLLVAKGRIINGSIFFLGPKLFGPNKPPR